MEHVMLDLETLGTASDAVVLSVGAVKFDEQLISTDTFHFMASVQQQIDSERTVTSDTISWWMRQSEETRGQFNSSGRIQLPVGTILTSFTEFFKGSIYIWSHGSNFDTVILENMYTQWGRPEPWGFSNVRDTRTLFDIFTTVHPTFEPVLREHLKPKGLTAHNAMVDAWNQAKAVQYAMSEFKP